MKLLFRKTADFFRESDKLMLILCFFATAYGCLSIYTTTNYLETSRPFIIQNLCAVIGLLFAIIISMIDYEHYLKNWYLFAVLGLIPIILTFFIGFAPEGTDDKAWLDLGITTFQPSELLKICFIITFSFHLSRVQSKINKLKYLIPVCIHGAIPVLIIHFQGDDGTALVFAFMVLFMMWSAGVSWKYFLIAFLSAAVSSPLIYFFVMNNEHRARIKSIFDIEGDIKGIGYQQWLGRRALSGGGLTGQGFLKGNLTQSGIIPESFNDFIFVGIGEELGFLGCLAVVIVLGAICLRCIRVARLSTKSEGKLICVGVFSMIFTQMFINVGMCSSVLPVIGITLPFFSAGGTSLICLYMGIGLVLNVYRHRNSRVIYLHG